MPLAAAQRRARNRLRFHSTLAARRTVGSEDCGVHACRAAHSSRWPAFLQVRTLLHVVSCGRAAFKNHSCKEQGRKAACTMRVSASAHPEDSTKTGGVHAKADYESAMICDSINLLLKSNAQATARQLFVPCVSIQ